MAYTIKFTFEWSNESVALLDIKLILRGCIVADSQIKQMCISVSTSKAAIPATKSVMYPTEAGFETIPYLYATKNRLYQNK